MEFLRERHLNGERPLSVTVLFKGNRKIQWSSPETIPKVVQVQ